MQLKKINSSLSAQLMGLLILIRPKQWIKNGFVLAPLMFSGSFLHIESMVNAFLAALFFCVASSATYILNDIKDIEQDKLHPKKSKNRPLASGLVTRTAAMTLMVCLYFILGLSYFILPKVLLIILCYLGLNIAYTFALKHQPVIDIFTIAIGFVLRVIAGSMALNVPISNWMFITTLCLALYLAAIKRRQELAANGTDGRKVLKKYSIELVDRYAEMSATGALVFYSLFVMQTKQQLIITVPIVLFGLFRYWYVVDALNGGESPTDALMADWQLLVTIVLWIVVCGWALWPAIG